MKDHIHANQLRELSLVARSCERKRASLNTHDTLDAPVQRLFIATEPDTYIRPHRHSESHKWEFFLILQGSMDLLIFNADGTLAERTLLGTSRVRAVEIPPGTWHSYVCRQRDTLALEIKEGAYLPTGPADFAPWSPAGNSSDCVPFLDWMRVARVGALPPRLADIRSQV